MSKYSIENCSLYRVGNIGGKTIVIFDDHNMALPAGGQMSSTIGKAAELLTFDTHTDTRPPFTNWFCHHSYDLEISLNHPEIRKILNGKHYRREDFDFENVFAIASGFLKNDEHILTAYDFGYITSYDVVCRLSNSDAKEYERQDRGSGRDAHYYSTVNQIKDRAFSKPIIVDFDLDYFIDPNVIDNNFIEAVQNIIRSADLITIAREPHFVEMCCSRYAVDRILGDLMAMLKRILEP